MLRLLKKKKVLLVFVIFFLLLYLQHQFMWLYHDDYGYASLSYSYVVDGVSGTNFTFKELIAFLIGHYQVWGGRILFFAIECLLLKVGLPLFRLVQALIITGTFYLIYILISNIYKKVDKFKLSIFVVSLYGVFQLAMYRDVIFWATASVLYIFPLFPFLLFIYFYYLYDKLKVKNKILFLVINGFLVFISSFSQEQVSVLVMSTIVIKSFLTYIKTKEINKDDIIMIFCSFLGLSILMLAPGNSVRMNFNEANKEFYSLPLFSKIFRQLPSVIVNNFCGNTKIFTLLLFSACTYIVCSFIKKEKNNYRTAFFCILLISHLLVLFSFAFFENGIFEYIYAKMLGIDSKLLYVILLFFLIIPLIGAIISIIIYLLKEKNDLLFSLFIGSILSQACMVVTSYFPLRSAIIFQFICFIVLGTLFSKIFVKKSTLIKSIVLYVFVFCMFFNYSKILIGYYSNNKVNKENDLSLRETSKNIKDGKNVDIIYLEKLPDISYSSLMPYQEGFEYILFYIREYYDLPEGIKIIYN